MQIKSIIRNVFSAVQDAETSQRGYLLTLDQSYLDPYYISLENLRENTKLFERFNSVYDVQNIRFKRLTESIAERLSEIDATIQLAQQGDLAKAKNLLTSHVGRELMTKIRGLVLELEADEELYLASWRSELEESHTNAILTLAASLILSLILLTAVYFLTMRNQRQQIQHAEWMMEANDNLERQVETRTAQLEAFSQELKRSNRELQDFAFVASHDLQEPLRKIRAFGDRLEQKYGDRLEDTGSDYIRRMQNAAGRMSNLIDDLLTYSRVSTRAGDFAPTSLQQVLEEVLEDLEVRIEETGAVIESNELPQLMADPSQMRQLLQNLIGNAVKFARPGINPVVKVIGTIESSQEKESVATVVLKVQDNGIGFDTKFSDRIFSPFQRLHQRHEFEGTGIGLAVCRRIVERHGGSIQAMSREGEGALFIIELPRDQQAAVIQEEQQ